MEFNHKIASCQKCRPQYRFFKCGNSSNIFEDMRPFILRIISDGLIVGGAVFNDEGAKALAFLLKNSKKLRYLSLKDVQFTGNSQKVIFDALKKNNTLIGLELTDWFLDSDLLSQLVDVLKGCLSCISFN